MEDIKLYNGDCLEIMKTIKDKSIDLVINDAPYFSTKIKEVGDKQWNSEDEYINWCLEVIKESQRVLKDNGSFYWFHNDINIMVEILHRIKKETNFILKNQIIWSKLNNWKSANIKDGAGMYRSILQCYGNQRSYNGSTSEYIYYFTFQDGMEEIYGNENNFKAIRDYFQEQRELAGLKTCKQINQLLGVDCNGGGMASHYFGKKIKQWALPTKDMYLKLQSCGYFQKPYEELEIKYNELKEQYQNLRYSFNQPEKIFKGKSVIDIREELKPYTTVWEYDRDHNVYGSHLTPKPVKMIEHIIKTSSNKNNIVLDCFMGSGSSGIASVNTGRKFIGIEKDEAYFEIAKNRIENTYNELNKN